MFVDKARESRPRGATLLHCEFQTLRIRSLCTRPRIITPLIPRVSQSAPPPFLFPHTLRSHTRVSHPMNDPMNATAYTASEPSPSAKSCAKLDSQVPLPALPLLHPAPQSRLRHSTRTVLLTTPSPTRPTSLQAYTVEHFTHAKTLGEYDDGGEWSGYKY